MRNSNKNQKTKAIIRSAVIFAALEGAGVYFWEIAEGGLVGFWLIFVHWISLSCFAAGPFAAWHGNTANRRKLIWSLYLIPCLASAFVSYHVWKPTLKADLAVGSGWRPPELPKECVSVFMLLGDRKVVFPLFMAKMGDTNSGSRLPLKDLPNWLTSVIERDPDYSPRDKYSYFAYEAPTRAKDFEYILPATLHVSNNRLFVFAEMPFGKGKQRIAMNDELGSGLPRLWDRNYDFRKCEIVTDKGNPVFQVIYESADTVRVNGIFVVATNIALLYFNGKSLVAHAKDSKTADLAYYEATNAPIKMNSIFKYPSWKYPGVLAD